jgi:hypothetical protein
MKNESKKIYTAPRLDDRGSINAGTLGSNILGQETAVPGKLF